MDYTGSGALENVSRVVLTTEGWDVKVGLTVEEFGRIVKERKNSRINKGSIINGVVFQRIYK